MNAKIVFTLAVAFCAMQQSAADPFDIPSIIQSTVSAITQNSQNVIAQFNNATSKVVSDVWSKVNEIRQNIENDLKKGIDQAALKTSAAEACFQQLGAAFQKIVAQVRTEESAFINKEGSSIQPIVESINATIRKIQNDTVQDIQAAQACVSQPLNAPFCLIALANTVRVHLQQDFTQSQGEITQIIAAIPKVLQDGAAFFQKTITEVTTEGQAAATSAAQCLRNAVLGSK